MPTSMRRPVTSRRCTRSAAPTPRRWLWAGRSVANQIDVVHRLDSMPDQLASYTQNRTPAAISRSSSCDSM